jgi:hypothetical protein
VSKRRKQTQPFTLGELERRRASGEPIPAFATLTDHMRGAVDAEFGVGTAEQLGADIWFTSLPDSALEDLALRLRWRPRTRADRTALRQHADRAKQSESEARVLLAREGLFLASKDVKRAQPIRLGRRWIRGDDGRIARVAPIDLPPAEAFRWFAQAAKAAALAVLRGEDWPAVGPRYESLNEAARLGDVLLASEATAFAELSLQETTRAVHEALARALPTLSPDERIVIYALAHTEWDSKAAQFQCGFLSDTYFRQVKYKARMKLSRDPTLAALFRAF